jgi:hypothetical protein
MISFSTKVECVAAYFTDAFEKYNESLKKRCEEIRKRKVSADK